MRRRAFIKRASGLLVPLAFPAIVRGQGIPEPVLSLLDAPGSTVPSSPQLVLVTAQTLGTLRSNFTGRVGLEFTWGATPATCTALGRWKVAGNSHTHLLELRNASCVTQATCTVDASTGSVGYIYTDLVSPFTLAGNTTYFLLSNEVDTLDQWYDADTTVTLTTDATNDFGANSDGVTCFQGTAGRSFVPMNLKYHF